jgi:hypothetical protein
MKCGRRREMSRPVAPAVKFEYTTVATDRFICCECKEDVSLSPNKPVRIRFTQAAGNRTYMQLVHVEDCLQRLATADARFVLSVVQPPARFHRDYPIAESLAELDRMRQYHPYLCEWIPFLARQSSDIQAEAGWITTAAQTIPSFRLSLPLAQGLSIPPSSINSSQFQSLFSRLVILPFEARHINATKLFTVDSIIQYAKTQLEALKVAGLKTIDLDVSMIVTETLLTRISGVIVMYVRLNHRSTLEYHSIFEKDRLMLFHDLEQTSTYMRDPVKSWCTCQLALARCIQNDLQIVLDSLHTTTSSKHGIDWGTSQDIAQYHSISCVGPSFGRLLFHSNIQLVVANKLFYMWNQKRKLAVAYCNESRVQSLPLLIEADDTEETTTHSSDPNITSYRLEIRQQTFKPMRNQSHSRLWSYQVG